LAAEHALPRHRGRTAAKEVYFQLLEIEKGEKVLDSGGHGRARKRGNRSACFAAPGNDPILNT